MPDTLKKSQTMLHKKKKKTPPRLKKKPMAVYVNADTSKYAMHDIRNEISACVQLRGIVLHHRNTTGFVNKSG